MKKLFNLIKKAQMVLTKANMVAVLIWMKSLMGHKKNKSKKLMMFLSS